MPVKSTFLLNGLLNRDTPTLCNRVEKMFARNVPRSECGLLGRIFATWAATTVGVPPGRRSGKVPPRPFRRNSGPHEEWGKATDFCEPSLVKPETSVNPDKARATRKASSGKTGPTRAFEYVRPLWKTCLNDDPSGVDRQALLAKTQPKLGQIAANAACARSISIAPTGRREVIISMKTSKR